MIIDSLTKVCAAQAFTAAAVSLSSIDLGTPGGLGTPPKRVLGAGEPMTFAFTTDVAASCTTVKLEVIMATDAALTAGIIVLVEQTRLAADFAAGSINDLTLPKSPPAAGYLRFLGVRATPVGGAATVTLSAWLTDYHMVSPAFLAYAKNYTP